MERVRWIELESLLYDRMSMIHISEFRPTYSHAVERTKNIEKGQ